MFADVCYADQLLNGESVVLTKHLAMFEKDGYRTESHRTLSNEDYAGLINKER